MWSQLLLARVTPPTREITDWDTVVARQSEWTLHEAYHNLVPANASTGTWPLTPLDRQFAYIPTYVNDAGDCAAHGTQGTAHCQAQIFSYLEQLEPGLRYAYAYAFSLCLFVSLPPSTAVRCIGIILCQFA